MTTPGSAIEGKYEVLGKLREGGMGAIYMVRHRLLNEIRIIKVMRREVAESPDQRKRFLREAQTATRLKHPHIVGFYDFFVDEEGTAYMVMEYIDGITLRDMIRNCGALPISLGLYLARQCLAALDYLHRKGIVHRDIAPDNIMMTEEEDGTLQAKLIDLGIAKLARAEEQEQLTAADEFIGKLRYSSPEQLTKKASSDAIDGRSDLFSFGVVLYEALTGVCPYGGGSLQDILVARLQRPPMPFTQSDPHNRLGTALRGMILKALQVNVSERFQTAAEFSRAVEAIPAGEANPETPDQVQQYVRSAIEAARKAALAANPGAMSSLQRTLQSKFRVSEVSVQPLEATDFQVERTIARLGGEKASPGQGAEQTPGQDKTVLAPTAAGRTVLEPGRRRPISGYALAAAVLVAGGIGLWMWVSRSRRAEPAQTLAQPTAAVAVAVTAPPLNTPVRAEPTAVPPAPTPERVAEKVVNSDPKKPVKHPESTVPRTSRNEREQPRKTAQFPPPSDNHPNRPRQRFCSEVGRTGYFQGVPKEVPPGFKDVAGLPARDDAARIRIAISVLPENPVEGEEFTIVATFINGGDGAFRMIRAEESAASARGGFQPIPGVAMPTAVDEGGKLEIYRTRRALGPGDTYHKAFRVVEQRRNDAWESSVTVKPCVEQ